MHHLHRSFLLALAVSFVASLVVSCGDDGDSAQQRRDSGSDTADDADDADPADTAPDVPSDGGDDATIDAAEDIGADGVADADAPVDPLNPGLNATPVQDGVDPAGVPIDIEPQLGEVYAGQVSDGTGGFGGVQASCKPGDFVLLNARARFCIEGLVSNKQLFFSGGKLVDAEPVGVEPPEGETGRDRLDIASSFINLGTNSASRVEVVRDGSEGLAVVRVEGRVEPVMYIVGVAATIGIFPVPPVNVITEYRLRPDSQRLEIVSIFVNEGDRTVTIGPGDIIFWGDTTRYTYPGTGITPPAFVRGLVGYGDGVGYAFATESDTRTVSIPAVELPATATQSNSFPVASGARAAERRHFFVGIDGGDALQALADELPDHPLAIGNVAATVVAMRNGEPLPSALLHVTQLVDGEPAAGEWLGGYTDENGSLGVYAPPGDYRVAYEGFDGQTLAEQDVTISEGAELTIVTPDVGTVDIQLTERIDDATTDSPGRVVLSSAGQRTRTIYVLRGSAEVDLPPGTWSYVLSRGPEFTATTGEIEVLARQTAVLSGEVERVVPTPGLASGEFHQHQSPSLDSEVAVVDRIMCNLAEGVDFAVSSDHDIATDFGPYIDELGIRDLMASLAGVEVSPVYGHYGVYPVQYDIGKTARGALPLAYYDEDGEIQAYSTPAELTVAMRAMDGVRMIQLNHPRDSGSIESFNWVHNTMIDSARAGMDWTFDTMEIINDSNCAVIADWMALTNMGLKVVGIGNSDTHGRRGSGYPRNYIAVDDDDPAALDEGTIIDGTLSGDVVVSGIALIEFLDDPDSTDAVRPGRMLNAQTVEADIRVLSPPWAEATSLTVFKDGQRVETLDIGGGPGAVVDFEGSVTLDASDGDASFVIMAWNDARDSVVYPGEEIFAIANPIWLDADGSGAFDAPGIVAIDPAPALCP